MADILIVDDNEIAIIAVDRLLSKEGYNVIPASNGKEALRLLEQFTFDLMVTDLEMPFVTGFDLIRHVKATQSEMPVIVVSSRSDERSKMECYKLGVETYLDKPVTPFELVMKIKRLVGA